MVFAADYSKIEHEVFTFTMKLGLLFQIMKGFSISEGSIFLELLQLLYHVELVLRFSVHIVFFKLWSLRNFGFQQKAEFCFGLCLGA